MAFEDKWLGLDTYLLNEIRSCDDEASSSPSCGATKLYYLDGYKTALEEVRREMKKLKEEENNDI